MRRGVRDAAVRPAVAVAWLCLPGLGRALAAQTGERGAGHARDHDARRRPEAADLRHGVRPPGQPHPVRQVHLLELGHRDRPGVPRRRVLGIAAGLRQGRGAHPGAAGLAGRADHRRQRSRWRHGAGRCSRSTRPRPCCSPARPSGSRPRRCARMARPSRSGRVIVEVAQARSGDGGQLRPGRRRHAGQEHRAGQRRGRTHGHLPVEVEPADIALRRRERGPGTRGRGNAVRPGALAEQPRGPGRHPVAVGRHRRRRRGLRRAW